MAKSRTKIGKIKYVVLIAALILCVPVGRRIAQAALENSTSTATRSVNVSDADIEVSTLVIGSHLINLQGLSDSIYQAAMDSANEFNQNSIYYKSELANGQWYEITDASSIADISTSGVLVDKSVIEALEFTHKTDANGVTTDLRTGNTVSVYDINSPYDLEAMEELEPILLRYQMLLEKSSDGRTSSDKKYIEMLRTFFATDVQTDDTRNCDAYILSLEAYRQDKNNRGATAAELDTIDSVSGSVDASRRVVVFNELDELLDTLLNKAQGISVTTNADGTTTTTDEDTSLVVDSDIVSAIGDAINNVETSLTSYEGLLIDEGSTVISKKRYSTTNDFVTSASSFDYDSCDNYLTTLCAISNILDDKIVDNDAELSLLKNELVPQTKENYEKALKAGASSDYIQALSEGASDVVGERYLREQRTEVNALYTDYQTMLEAMWKRMGNDEAQADLLSRLDDLDALADSIPDDSAASYMKEALDAQKLYLKESYGELVAEGSASSDMDALEDEKADLEKQYQNALDSNDLAAAELLEAQIEAVDSDIEALEADYLAILGSPNSTESDKAKAMAGLGDGTAASAISSLGDSFLSALSDATASGDSSSSTAGSDDAKQLLNELSNNLAAISELSKISPAAASAALSDINDALQNTTALSDQDLSDIQTEVSDLKEEAEANAENNAAATMSASAARELLDSVLGDILGTDYDSASDAQKAEALLAMEWFGEQSGNSNISTLAASLANEQAADGSIYLYDKYSVESGDYLSLRAAANVLGYRPIYYRGNSTETLSKGMSYYTFTNGQSVYEMTGSTTKKMTRAAGLQDKQLYITATDGKQIFSLNVEAIDKAVYDVAYDADMKSVAEEILAALQEAAS